MIEECGMTKNPPFNKSSACCKPEKIASSFFYLTMEISFHVGTYGSKNK